MNQNLTDPDELFSRSVFHSRPSRHLNVMWLETKKAFAERPGPIFPLLFKKVYFSKLARAPKLTAADLIHVNYCVNFDMINVIITGPTHTDRLSRNLIGSEPVCKSPYSPGNSIQPGLSRAYVC